ncbi:MAG: proline iminopeptidase-family hydrolase [Thermomicrobiales bacterium]
MNKGEMTSDGVIAFRGFNVWYGIAGERDAPGKIPLLVVHGGPGLPHDALEPLARLAATDRRVIFYDQLGCGNSDRPADPTLYSIDLFVEELGVIRESLDLTTVHLLGHSYGGPLCLQYVLTQHPEGLASLILSDTFASVPALVAGWNGLRAHFPREIREIMERHEAAGTTDSEEYQAAMDEYFIAQHVLTVPPPEGLIRAQQKMNTDVYRALHGPSWFEATGEYATWDVTNRLHEITAPTLVIAGRHDQCVPELSESIHREIVDSSLAILENSSHVPFIEQPDMYDALVIDFMDRVEESRALDSHG